MNNANLSFLPDPGPGRTWAVDLNPKSQTKPIVVKLIERYKRGARGAKTVLNSEYTVADEKAISNAAQDILDRIGNYEKFIGEFDHADA